MMTFPCLSLVFRSIFLYSLDGLAPRLNTCCRLLASPIPGNRTHCPASGAVAPRLRGCDKRWFLCGDRESKYAPKTSSTNVSRSQRYSRLWQAAHGTAKTTRAYDDTSISLFKKHTMRFTPTCSSNAIPVLFVIVAVVRGLPKQHVRQPAPEHHDRASAGGPTPVDSRCDLLAA